MHAQPIRHRLDERRHAVLPRPLHRFLRRHIHRQRIIPVDLNPIKPVRQRLLRNRLGSRLRMQRNRNRPLIILTEENDRQLVHPREVHGLMKVTFARRPVPEVTQHRVLLPAYLHPPRQTHRVRNLRRDRHRDRQIVHPFRRRTTLLITTPKPQHRLQRPPAMIKRPRLTKRRDHPILFLQADHRRTVRRLLPPARTIRPDPPLPLHIDAPLIQPPRR